MNNDKKSEPLKSPFHLATAEFISMTRDFSRMEAAGGIVLILASILALIIANSALYPYYDYILNKVYFHVGFIDSDLLNFQIEKSVLHWINDGLMALFFFLVGLEIKEEIVEGSLSSLSKIALPVVAAIGGMAVPAAIYYFINMDTPANLHGWAIPTATDIAFALCVLSFVGSRAPLSLKILLTAIAIIDDIGAILIIGVFYSDGIATNVLLFCLIPLLGLFLLNRKGVGAKGPYILLGLILWMAVLESGVHATLAGVLTALFIPVHVKNKREGRRENPVSDLQHGLHPWVAFMVLPIFGFANAGVPFDGMGWDSLLEPVTLGIAAGLFFGKQIGVFACIAIPVLLGLVKKPEGAGWLQIYAVSMLCGIGFTMSLFIGGLAFADLEMQAGVRLGVLVGSVASAVIAYLVLVFASRSPQRAV